MLISSGSTKASHSLSVLSNSKTEQTSPWRAAPQNVYDSNNPSAVVMLWSWILTHSTCSSAQVARIYPSLFSQAQRTRVNLPSLPFLWALQENDLYNLKWTEILNSSDTAGYCWKWDLNLQVFELKPQLCQELLMWTGRIATKWRPYPSNAAWTPDVKYTLLINSHWGNYPSNNLKTYTLQSLLWLMLRSWKASQVHWGENLEWLTGVWPQVFSHMRGLRVLGSFGSKTRNCNQPFISKLEGHVASEDYHTFSSEKCAGNSRDKSGAQHQRCYLHIYEICCEKGVMFSRSLVWKTPPERTWQQ